MMRSRAVREGAVGLLVLGGVLSFAGLFAWVYNLQLGTQGYRFTVRYDAVSGLAEGANVRYRGVNIGRVTQVIPRTDGVQVEVEIRSAARIPRASTFVTSQTGLVGETVLEIQPEQDIEPSTIPGDPLSPACDSQQLVCSGDMVLGVTGVDYGQLLTTIDQLSRRFNDDIFFETFESTLEGVGQVSGDISSLSTTIEAKVESIDTSQLDLSQFTAAAQSIQSAAQSLQEVGTQLNGLVGENRASLNTSVQNVQQATAQLQDLSASLSTLVADPQIQTDLRNTLTQTSIAANNAAAATAELQQLTTELNDPGTLATLRQTLDSARITFQNAQKISADIDDLTGDPQFRDNLKNLVNGISDLVSTAPTPPGDPFTAPALYTPQTPPNWVLIEAPDLSISTEAQIPPDPTQILMPPIDRSSGTF